MAETTMEPMRVVVTGGAGFVGSHLCERMLSEGHEVICVDNLQTGSMHNIEKFMDDAKFSFVNHDVRESLLGRTDVEWEGVKEVYNLACPASPPLYQIDGPGTLMTNILGAYHCLEFCLAMGARALLASTSEVYGDPEMSPQPESYRGNTSCTGPRACYDEGKRSAETLFFDYHRKYCEGDDAVTNGFAVRVIRIFNTYGPCLSAFDGRIISNCVRQALAGVPKNDEEAASDAPLGSDPITIYGTGLQTRSFQYVSDLIEGMTRMMRNDIGFAGPVNIGNPSERTILDLVQNVIRLTGSKSEIVFSPAPVDDPMQRKPDITVAKEKLGWEPVVDLEEGLLKTIEYFRNLDMSKVEPPASSFDPWKL